MKIVSEKGNRKSCSVLYTKDSTRHTKSPSHFVVINLPLTSVYSVVYLTKVIVLRIQFIACAGRILFFPYIIGLYN